jgi:hypothetical protein
MGKGAQKKLRFIVVATVAGVLFFALIIYLYSLSSKVLRPIQWDAEKIHKITIESYETELNQQLLEDTREDCFFLYLLNADVDSTETYTINVIDEDSLKDIVSTLGKFSVEDHVYSKTDVSDETPAYKIIAYDEEENEITSVSFYSDMVEAGQYYKLEKETWEEDYQTLQKLCEKYNTQWVEGDVDSYTTTPYASEHNLYQAVNIREQDMNGDYENRTALYQYRLDSSHAKEISIPGFIQLLYVGKEKIYYQKEDTSQSCICAAPIQSGKDEDDEIDMENEEIILQDTSMEELYMDEQYIMYVTGIYGRIVIYDYVNKKVINYANSSMGSDTHFARCGTTVIQSSVENLSILPQGTSEWQKITLDGEFSILFPNARAWDSKLFFYGCANTEDYTEDVEVMKYDVESGENQVFIDKKEVSDSVSKLFDKKEEISTMSINNLFLDGERLYVQLCLCIRDNGDDGTNQYVILSKGLQDSKVQVEKKLTKILWEKRDFDLTDSITGCYFLQDGKAYLSLYDKKKQKKYFSIYNLEKGKLKTVSENDKKFYTPLFYRRFSDYAYLSYEKKYNKDVVIDGVYYN